MIERLFALIILFFLFPIFLIFYIIVKFDSKGPFLFKQKRLGKDKKPFYIYKIRTMIENAEELKKDLIKKNEAKGPVFKIKDDPRYTKIGRWLAKKGLDELPQLINILKGEMSCVGPRPFPINEALKIPKKYQSRFSVKPGIISTWAVSGAFHNDFEKWMEMDLKDIKNKSFFWDLLIIIKGIKLFFVYLFKNENKLQ